jgi:hypothetical protein
MHHAHTADTRSTAIFIHNDAPQALLDCYENRMAGFSLMHYAHTADTGSTAIFIHNDAPQALLDCHENSILATRVIPANAGIQGPGADRYRQSSQALSAMLCALRPLDARVSRA